MQKLLMSVVLLGSTTSWAQSVVDLPDVEPPTAVAATAMDLSAVRVHGVYDVTYSAVVGDGTSVHAKTPFTITAKMNVDADDLSTVVWLSDIAVDGDATGHLREVFLAAPFVVHRDAAEPAVFMAAVDDAHRRLLLRLVHLLAPPTTITPDGQASAPFGERQQRFDVTGDVHHPGRWHLGLTEQRYGKGLRALTFVPVAASTVVEASSAHQLQSTQTELVLNKRHRGRTVSMERHSFRAQLVQPVVIEDGARAKVADVVAGGRLALYAVPPDYEERLAGKSWKDVTAHFEAHVDNDYAEANAWLRYWLRLHPASSQTAVEWINSFPQERSFRERRGFALSAVAAAGHVEAQHALRWALTHANSHPATKERTSKALLSLEMPEAFLLQALLEMHADVPTTTLAARQHRAMLLNVFGAMGGVEHGVDDNTQFAVDALQEKLNDAPSARAKGEVLVALGNTGAFDEVYAIALPYFSSNSVTLRRRAFHAFQKATGDDAFHLFMQHYGEEHDASVRRSAAHLAQVMAPSMQRRQWAAAELSTSPDATIRSIAADVLGHELVRHPQNAAVLFAALQTERDAEVRDTIFRFISVDGQPHSKRETQRQNPLAARGWIGGAQ